MSPSCATLQVSLFSENSSRWLVADQGTMLCGAADAVRGASSPAEELAFITRQSDSAGLTLCRTSLISTDSTSLCSLHQSHA